jgi:trimeric autotransporter adhesin
MTAQPLVLRPVLLLVLLASFLALEPMPRAEASTTFTVNSDGDGDDEDFPGGIFDGSSDRRCDTNTVTPGRQCSLRAAIQESNKVRGRDTIAFNIPGASVHTIFPQSGLPTVQKPVTIDGYTQPGAVENTIPLATNGTNAVLMIELIGSDAGTSDGLFMDFGASGSAVRGLVIRDFFSSGLRALGDDYRIQGNFLGTNPPGMIANGNRNGVTILGDDSRIGGTSPAARNLISGNESNAIQAGGEGNVVQGNVIGTKADGAAALPNDGSGVNGSTRTLIGDPDPTDGLGGANLIAFNTGQGVAVGDTRAPGNRILTNSIHDNGELGINLGGGTQDAHQVTENDLDDPSTTVIDPDTDGGPNRLQNYPVITSAQTVPGPFGFTSIGGTLDSLRSTRRTPMKFLIQFFSNPAEDASGHGEGQTYLGQKTVTTNRRGHASFSFSPVSIVPVGSYVTATATNKATGDTSEFSEARIVTELEPTS